MKPTDLMVSDIVSLFDDEGCIIPTKIKEIRGETVIASINSDDIYDELYYEGIMPIPLTSEILEKNFFDVSDKEVKRYYFEEDGQCYHFSLRQMYDKENKPKGYSFYAFNVLTIIDYVHELQHALRLVGLNDLADNLKI